MLLRCFSATGSLLFLVEDTKKPVLDLTSSSEPSPRSSNLPVIRDCYCYCRCSNVVALCYDVVVFYPKWFYGTNGGVGTCVVGVTGAFVGIMSALRVSPSLVFTAVLVNLVALLLVFSCASC